MQGWKKNRNKNWDGGYLYYPFLHSTTVSHYVLHVHSVQWNAGMGNTDTLHPNSCFCSFSIPTSEIFQNKIFVTSYSIDTHRNCIAKHMIKQRISADWRKTKPIAPFSCTPRVQQVHSKAQVIHLTPGLPGLLLFFNSHAQEMYCKTYD